MVPISLLLCARLRGDGAGSAAASTPYPVPFPVIPSGVIPLVCRDSIFLSSSSLLCSKYQRFVPRTTNFPPPNQKISFISYFACPIWTNWQIQFAIKCTLEWELRFKRLNFCTAFWRRPHAIEPKMEDPVQSWNLKNSTSIFRTSVFNVDFKNLKNNLILNLGMGP